MRNWRYEAEILFTFNLSGLYSLTEIKKKKGTEKLQRANKHIGFFCYGLMLNVQIFYFYLDLFRSSCLVDLSLGLKTTYKLHQ